jgi:Fe-coproporphyrin III synthase
MSGPAGNLPALQIHPTRRCNLSCLHCYSDSSPKIREALEPELVLAAIADAAALGYKIVAVSGGEPLLYAPLARVLRFAHEKGLATTVTTNGMLLDARRLAMLAEDTDLIAISLDGVPASHDEMRGSPRAFRDMQRRLEAVRATGIPFGFIFTLTFHNVNELDWVARFAVEQGAGLLQIHPLESVGRAVTKLEGSLPDACESAVALIEAARLREEYGDRIQIQVDLATLPAVEAQPERIFADGQAPCGEKTVAEVFAPLVLETSGILAPLQYGFPRAWCLGNIRDASLRDLSVRWMLERYSLFQAMCREVRAGILDNTDVPVFSWYAEVQQKAAQFGPECWLPRPQRGARGKQVSVSSFDHSC